MLVDSSQAKLFQEISSDNIYKSRDLKKVSLLFPQKNTDLLLLFPYNLRKASSDLSTFSVSIQ